MDLSLKSIVSESELSSPLSTRHSTPSTGSSKRRRIDLDKSLDIHQQATTADVAAMALPATQVSDAPGAEPNKEIERPCEKIRAAIYQGLAAGLSYEFINEVIQALCLKLRTVHTESIEDRDSGPIDGLRHPLPAFSNVHIKASSSEHSVRVPSHHSERAQSE